jgi:O-antigen ligase
MALTSLLFLALFGGTLLLALIRHPMYGLFAYLLAFYGHPSARWWGADLPDLRWSFVAAAVTLIGTLRLERSRNKPSWYRNAPASLLIAFTIWLWLQQFWALSAADHVFLATMYTKYLILFYIIYRIIADERALFLFLLAHVAGCAYYGWLTLGATGSVRVEFIGGPNMDGASAFAAQLTTGLIVAGILLFQTRGIVRILVLVAIPVILNGLILTQSRGGFLGLLGGALAVLYLCPATNRKRVYSVGVLAVVLFFMLAHDAFWERMGTIGAAVEREEMDTSAEGRWELLQAQWKMFTLDPIRGNGHRGTVVLSPLYLEEKYLTQGGRSSHNTLMTVLVEQGIVGTVIYLAIIVWSAVRLKRLKALDRVQLPTSLGFYRAAIGGALVSLFVAGQFADLLRLEVAIWCLVLLVAVTRFAKEAMPSGSDRAEISTGFSTESQDVARNNRTTV